jgi:tetratricopeptide (TPR) repeat protein
MPKNPRALANRGHCRMVLGDLEHAAADFRAALAVAPEFAPVMSHQYSELSYQYAARQNYQGCIRAANTSVKLAPTNPDGYGNRGACESGLSKFKPALKDLTKAISLNPKLTGAYATRVGVQASLGHCKEAREDAERARALDTAGEYKDALTTMLRGCQGK